MARYFHNKLPEDENHLSLNQGILLKRLLQEAILMIRNSSLDPICKQEELEDVVRDVSVALTGKNNEIGEKSEDATPNGVKSGESNYISDEKLYDGLLPIITQQEYEENY